jgi:hypothetical protein
MRVQWNFAAGGQKEAQRLVRMLREGRFQFSEFHSLAG